MKLFHKLPLALALSFGFFSAYAQPGFPRGEESAKEVVKLMQSLPADAQARILDVAKREVSSLEARKKAELLTNKAVAAPMPPLPPAPPVTPLPQTITAAPLQTGGTAISTNTTIAPPPPPPAPPAPPATPDFQVKAESLPKTSVQWKESTFDFGKIKQGETVTHKYTFKNTGKEPLQITHVKPACGCTTPNWSKDPVAPGAEGFVELSFNSAGKMGLQNKSVTLYSNTDPVVQSLNFTGEIFADPAATPPAHDHDHSDPNHKH